MNITFSLYTRNRKLLPAMYNNYNNFDFVLLKITNQTYKYLSVIFPFLLKGKYFSFIAVQPLKINGTV